MPNVSRDGCCSHGGCAEPIYAKRMCKLHYGRDYQARNRKKFQAYNARRRKTGLNRAEIAARAAEFRAQTKTCRECGEVFSPRRNMARSQWARAEFCGQSCGNAWKARGCKPAPLGALSKRKLGQAGYQLAWQQRRALPHWAAWWEDQRRKEDLAEITAPPALPGPSCRLSQRPSSRLFVGCQCACGTWFVSHKGKHNGSSRCSRCTKRYWKGNHRQRADRYGRDFEVIIKEDVFAADRWRCQICGCRVLKRSGQERSATLDHIIPMARGGHHVLANAQTACSACNSRKGAGAANDQLRLSLAA